MTQLHALARGVDHPAPARETVPRWRLVAAIALAPAAFSAQVVGSYVVASSYCHGGAHSQAALVVINVLATITAVIGLVIAVASSRATRSEKPGGAQEAIDIGEGRTRFMALCGLWSSVIFVLAIALELTAIATFGTCAAAIATG